MKSLNPSRASVMPRATLDLRLEVMLTPSACAGVSSAEAASRTEVKVEMNIMVAMCVELRFKGWLSELTVVGMELEVPLDE